MGDNIDKDVKPRHVRVDRQTKLLHYFHVFAIHDRIDTSHLPEAHSVPPELHLNDILPTPDDYTRLKSMFTILVSRILCDNIDFFKTHFSKVVVRHINHVYSKEMSEVSHIVRYSKILIVVYFFNNRYLLVFN